MAENESNLERARKRAKVKMDFIRHVAAYLTVMVILAIINNLTDSSYQWWLWPALGWGIGIVAHFLTVFIGDSGLEKKLIEKELQKMDDEQSES